jgi:hypothetical protein
LIRLYVGFLLFTLSDALNPEKRPFTFEQWYMIYFHDLQLWEKRTTRTCTVFSNLSVDPSRIVKHNLGKTVSGVQDSDSQVIEVVDRLVDLARVGTIVMSVLSITLFLTLFFVQENWFLLDQYSLRQASYVSPGSMPEDDWRMIRQYVNWLPMNPETNSVARLYIRQVHVSAMHSFFTATEVLFHATGVQREY